VSHRGSLLIVDDEPEVVDLLHDLFQAQGYAVTCALNGRDALVLASLARPDAVILDIRMPGLDGPEVLRDLLLMDDSVAVVMLSGTDDEGLACELLKTGAFDYIRKPFVLDNIERIVELAVLLGRRPMVPDENLPWLCDPRTFIDETPLTGAETPCVCCRERMSPADPTAVRERDGLYHALCWLRRAGHAATDRQLVSS
jgi:CheY-like chemotaxis protein